MISDPEGDPAQIARLHLGQSDIDDGGAVIGGGSLTGEKCQQGLRVAGRMLDLVPDDVLAQLKGA